MSTPPKPENAHCLHDGRKVITIDCQYVFPKFAAAYLVTDGNEAAFIENNTAHCVPKLLAALECEGLPTSAVKYIIVTHVHLDHAGGTSALLKSCPKAVVLAHPRAAKHLIDPSKLIASARHVYGDENYTKLYGQIEPIPAERVRIMNDQEELEFGSAPLGDAHKGQKPSRRLRFIYTRGHANHHFCIYDPVTRGVFTGDSFGVAYPRTCEIAGTHDKEFFIFPTTSPTDFDPKEAKLSLTKITELGPKRVFLTHFGEVTQVQAAAEQLKEHLNFSEALMQQCIAKAHAVPPSVELTQQLEAFCRSQLDTHYRTVLQRKGILSDAPNLAQSNAQVWDLLKLDLDLNAAGIVHSALRAAAPRT